MVESRESATRQTSLVRQLGFAASDGAPEDRRANAAMPRHASTECEPPGTAQVRKFRNPAPGV